MSVSVSRELECIMLHASIVHFEHVVPPSDSEAMCSSLIMKKVSHYMKFHPTNFGTGGWPVYIKIYMWTFDYGVA